MTYKLRSAFLAVYAVSGTHARRLLGLSPENKLAPICRAGAGALVGWVWIMLLESKGSQSHV